MGCSSQGSELKLGPLLKKSWQDFTIAMMGAFMVRRL